MPSLRERELLREITIPVLIVVMVLLLAVASLGWFGYRASGEWRRNAAIVVERRVDEVTTLLLIALSKDMPAAQEYVLTSFSAERMSMEGQYEIINDVSRMFARFPYPESLFVWWSNGNSTLYSRSDRPPAWEKTVERQLSFPVTVIRDSAITEQLALLARKYALHEAEFAFFETFVDGIPYQVVARLLYRRESNREVFSVVGFTVNLDWVRTGYFPELITQVERIGKTAASTLSLSIVDEGSSVVAQTRLPNGDGPLREREFPLTFFDSSAASIAALAHMPLRQWTARVTTADDALLQSANASIRRTLTLVLVAAATSIVGILLALRSLRTNAQLVAMKTDFVAMVTHELKTPLAGIKLIGDTLEKRRNHSAQDIAEYGALISKQTARLTLLIDNLLRFSQISDSKNIYNITSVDIEKVLIETLAILQSQIREGNFEVRLEISQPLPNVRCDREAITQVFENLIENALKYSAGCKKIEVRAFESGGRVNVLVNDSGKGILPEDVRHVFEQFYRGRNAGAAGSGLGLTIAQKIIKDHRGDIFVNSVPGQGTAITVVLPAISSSIEVTK